MFKVGVRLVVYLLITFIGIAFARNGDGTRENRIIVGNEDFYLIRQGLVKEFWLSYNGYLASETSVPNEHYPIMLRQITDGSSLYQGVFDEKGTLKDCDFKRQRRDVEDYLREFELDAKQGKKHKSSPNITVSYTPLAKGNIGNDQLSFFQDMVDFQKLKMECRQLHVSMNEDYERQRTKPSRQKRSIIYPGTKWCGAGNTALHDNDYGSDLNTDRCCKAHDRCPYYILGFQTKWHLFNSWFGTISHCDCDNSFKTCLRAAGTGTANMVGKLFFNVIKRSCFVLRKRKVCTKRSWWGSCKEKKKTLVGKFKGIKKYKPL